MYTPELHQRYKVCRTRASEKYRRKNLHKFRKWAKERRRNWTSEQRKKANEITYRYAKTPEGRIKHNCRRKTKSLLKTRGVDYKNQVCEVPSCYENAVIHHVDYRNAFYIRWLCQEHHWEIHRNGDIPGLLSHY